METTKVGIREFRQDMAEYISAGKPVTITKHGHTVGYFLPVQEQREANIAALRKVGAELDQVLAVHNVNIEDVVQEFKLLRKQARTKAA